MWLIAVDAHSKWPEVMPMKSTTSTKTIQRCRELFARHGVPQQLVSDNGPQFVSAEFEHFLKMNGIKHSTSAPYHPASNGLAERFVQTFKQALRASDSRVPVEERVAKFLLRYRNTPHATTNTSPAMLLMKRPLRTRLDALRPSLRDTVEAKQQHQAQGKAFLSPHEFAIGEAVMVKDYRVRGSNRWVPGVVKSKPGPLNYKIEVAPEVIWSRHVDQVRNGHATIDPGTVGVTAEMLQAGDIAAATTTESPSKLNSSSVSAAATATSTEENPTSTKTPVKAEVPERRYPTRERRAPKRLDL